MARHGPALARQALAFVMLLSVLFVMSNAEHELSGNATLERRRRRLAACMSAVVQCALLAGFVTVAYHTLRDGNVP
jgi:hypothetical protein